MLSSATCFIALFLYRYIRLVVNLVAFWTFKPIKPLEEPTLSSQDVTVIIPSLAGCGPELVETIRSILENEPFEIMLVTIDENYYGALEMIKSMPTKRIRVYSVANPNKRRQMVRAIPEVKTQITIFADDDVTWPSKTLQWMLAPFEEEKYGGVATCQRVRRKMNPNWSERFWGYLAALYLERRNFDCAATTHVDGGVPCLSGRTVAYRTKILQDEAFTQGFTDERWLGRYQLNADDDNFITRWMVSHGWKTYFQYHPEVEVQTTLEDNPKFLKQCARWSRSNWRSNLRSMFWEGHIWWRQPWSTYAVHVTTLHPPAFVVDYLLLFFCRRATASWAADARSLAWTALLSWMFVSKFIKLLGHYIRYPVDVLLLPASMLFGYFHGLIKVYALCSLDVTAWGSREGADANDAYRMRKLSESEREKSSQHKWEVYAEKVSSPPAPRLLPLDAAAEARGVRLPSVDARTPGDPLQTALRACWDWMPVQRP